MKSILNKSSSDQSKRFFYFFTIAFVLYAIAFASGAMAQAAPGGTTVEKVDGFFNNIKSILTVASVSVVTIAVIFAGYQIAFANKRIGDVAPILIGGLLIGAAGQIASMLLE